MTTLDILQRHQLLCDELHALALEENRFLREHRVAPRQELQNRKRALLGRLGESLDALRQVPRADSRTQQRNTAELTRSRILQFLQLDKENEQLLLRCSLAPGRPAAPAAPPAALGRVYGTTPTM
jgi:hypothetical protein